VRSGRFNISRGNQLGESIGSAPRLLIVPREDPKPQPAPVAVAELDPRPAPLPATPMTAAPISPEYQPVHDRLTALERLARLRDEGALTAKEYAAEKAKLLRPPVEEMVLCEATATPVGGAVSAATLSVTAGHQSSSAPQSPDATAPPLLLTAQGPALLDRIAVWKVVLLGLLAGLGLSYASQPRETVHFLEDLVKLFVG
jgi:hypothetical protein